MHRKQRGVTAIGWVLLLIPVGIVFYAGVRLFPMYLNYFNVARSMTQTASERSATESAQDLRFALEKHLDIEGITFPTIKEFTVRRDGPAWVVEIEYEDGAPLMSNISLVAKFQKSVTVGKVLE
jgi:hypothetical protein